MADDGSVIEVVTRARMRAENLSHRCTYVVVVVGPRDRFGVHGSRQPGAAPGAADLGLGPEDEIVVHLRASWKDVMPSHWDLAFGGVCGVGEGWASSARRELAEEAGIVLGPDDPLVDLGRTWFEDPPVDGRPGASIFGRAFLVSWPEEPVSVDGEAVAFDRVRLAGLDRWLASVPVCPDSAAVVAPRLLGR